MSCIITISREYGAGGHSIASRVARELGIEVYDKDIIRNTVKDSGLDQGIVEREEEEISRADAFLRMITPAAYVDRREAIHEIERKVILMLASKGPCVIIGRCADVILNEANVDSLNVFIYADVLHRAARVSELIDSKNPGEIQKAMKRHDAARHSSIPRSRAALPVARKNSVYAGVRRSSGPCKNSSVSQGMASICTVSPSFSAPSQATP